MGIKFVEYSSIDEEKWDQCIHSSFNSVVYAYSWYLDAVCEWDALIEGDYERIMPLPRKKKLGIELIYQPFFTQQLGVFSSKILSGVHIDAFIQAIPSKFKHIHLNFNTLNKFSKDNHLIAHQNHELDLINEYEKLIINYSKNLKRNLEVAKKHKLSIVSNIKPDELIALFRKEKGRSIKHLKEGNYLKLKRLIYTAIHKGIAEVYGVYNEVNELCAGAVFFRHNKKSIFLFSANTASGKSTRAMAFLIDDYIQKNSRTHLTLDFEGSDIESLARFYQGFGSKKTVYNSLIINRMNIMQRISYYSYQYFKNFFSNCNFCQAHKSK